MKTTRKFNFNDFFDFEQDSESRRRAAEPAAPPRVFSESDLAEACGRAFAEGQAARQAELELSDAHCEAMASQRIAEQFATLLAGESERCREFRNAAFGLAIAALRKILPDLARRFGQAELETAMAEILREQPDEPRIVARIPDALFDAIAGNAERIAAQAGYSGKLAVIADGGLGPADFRLEWADGGIERLTERTMANIAKAIARLAQAGDNSDSTGGLPAARSQEA
jgi:flagellar assembly protein FliH